MHAGLTRTPAAGRPLVAARPLQHSRAISVSVRAAAVNLDATAGDVKWNKSYYPTLSDTAKLNKDWCAP